MENLSGVRGGSWRVWVGLAAVLAASAFDESWPWGVLILLWIIGGVATGTIHFIEEIQAKRSPILFAAVTVAWAACGIYWIAIDLS